MSNQSRDIKKSNFIAQDTVADGATFDFVTPDGVNRKITFANLAALLGVTGSLQQEGEAAGTPVLNKSGTVNNIRNIVDGPGVKASVSPQGGVKVEHDFLNDSVGAAIMRNPTDQTITLRSIVAGSGMAVSEQNGTIEVAVSAVPVTTKTVVVNELSDFPVAVGGVITLGSDLRYLLTNDISTSNRFVLQSGSFLAGPAGGLVKLTYTGANTMLTSADNSNQVIDLNLDCPNGQLFDVSSTTGLHEFIFGRNVVESCDTIGTIDNMMLAVLEFVGFNDIVTDGITCLNNIDILVVSETSMALNGGTFLDLAAATLDGVLITAGGGFMGTGTTYLSGLVDSGNINAGGLGSVIQSVVTGPGATLNNISVDDALWQFGFNNTVPDTRPDCLMHNTGATVITIAAANTPVRIAPNWVEARKSQFSTDANGRMTYLGGKTIAIPVTFSVSCEAVSGTNKDVTFYVYKNGIQVAASAISNRVSAGSPRNTTLIWQDALATNDFIEIYVENNTDTIDILINDAAARLN